MCVFDPYETFKRVYQTYNEPRQPPMIGRGNCNYYIFNK